MNRALHSLDANSVLGLPISPEQFKSVFHTLLVYPKWSAEVDEHISVLVAGKHEAIKFVAKKFVSVFPNAFTFPTMKSTQGGSSNADLLKFICKEGPPAWTVWQSNMQDAPTLQQILRIFSRTTPMISLSARVDVNHANKCIRILEEGSFSFPDGPSFDDIVKPEDHFTFSRYVSNFSESTPKPPSLVDALSLCCMLAVSLFSRDSLDSVLSTVLREVVVALYTPESLDSPPKLTQTFPEPTPRKATTVLIDRTILDSSSQAIDAAHRTLYQCLHHKPMLVNMQSQIFLRHRISPVRTTFAATAVAKLHPSGEQIPFSYDEVTIRQKDFVRLARRVVLGDVVPARVFDRWVVQIPPMQSSASTENSSTKATVHFWKSFALISVCYLVEEQKLRGGQAEQVFASPTLSLGLLRMLRDLLV